MKNNQIAPSNSQAGNIPLQQASRVNNKKPQKVGDGESLSDRVERTKDTINVNRQIQQPQATYTKNQNKLAENNRERVPQLPETKTKPESSTPPITITLPEDYSYIDLEAMANIAKYCVPAMTGQDFKEIVTFCDDLKEVEDILKWGEKQGNGSLNKLVHILVSNCPPEKINGCNFLNYHLKIKFFLEGGNLETGIVSKVPFFTFLNDKKVQIIPYSKPPASEPLNLAGSSLRKFQIKYEIGMFACTRNNIEGASQAFRYILDNADNVLKDTKSAPRVVHELCSIINFLNPKYQRQYISKFREHFLKSPDIASAISNMLLKNGDNELSAEIFKDCITSFNDTRSNKAIGACLYNVALSLKRLCRYTEALPFAHGAYKHMPCDNDTLVEVIEIARYTDHHNLADEIIQNITKPHFKNLMMISGNAGYLDKANYRKQIKSMNETNIPHQFHPTLHLMRFIADQKAKYAQGSKINSNSFKQEIEKLIIKPDIRAETMLTLCINFNQNELARNILGEIDIERIKSLPYLQKYKAILLAGIDKNLIHEIATYHIKEDEKAELHFIAASNCIAAENFVNAKEHLQAALEVQPENEDYLQASFLTAVLSKDDDKIESSFNKLDTETKAELFSTFTYETETTESTTEITSGASTIVEDNYLEVKFDHQKIHAHFQAIKAQRLNKLSNFGNSVSEWKVGNANISTSKAVPLGTHNGLTYYGYIADKFQGAENAVLKTALEKGFAKRVEGVNGVKAFKGVFEIKIDGDERLYTNKVYRNEQGQLLLYFDRHGNHGAVKLFAKDNKRQTISS